MKSKHELDDPSVQRPPDRTWIQPFTPIESESFDIRDLEPQKHREPMFSRHQMRVRLLVYAIVILAVVLWFAMKVAETLY